MQMILPTSTMQFLPSIAGIYNPFSANSETKN